MTPLRTVPPCCVVSLGLGIGQRTGTCTNGRGDDSSGRSYCTALHLDAAESRFQVESEWSRMDPESSPSIVESSGTRTKSVFLARSSDLEFTDIQYHINNSLFRKVGVIESQTQRKTDHRCSSTTTRVQRNVHWSDGYGSSSASTDTICLRSESQRSGIGFNLRPEQGDLDDIDIDGVEGEFEEKTSVPEAPARVWNIQDIVQTIRYLISNSLIPLPHPLLKTSSSSSGFIVRLKSVTTSLTSALINSLFEKFPSRACSTVTTARRKHSLTPKGGYYPLVPFFPNLSLPFVGQSYHALTRVVTSVVFRILSSSRRTLFRILGIPAPFDSNEIKPYSTYASKDEEQRLYWDDVRFWMERMKGFDGRFNSKRNTCLRDVEVGGKGSKKEEAREGFVYTYHGSAGSQAIPVISAYQPALPPLPVTIPKRSREGMKKSWEKGKKKDRSGSELEEEGGDDNDYDYGMSDDYYIPLKVFRSWYGMVYPEQRRPTPSEATKLLATYSVRDKKEIRRMEKMARRIGSSKKLVHGEQEQEQEQKSMDVHRVYRREWEEYLERKMASGPELVVVFKE
ncbi:hypothetical protein K435DRAFT_848648 [Dendrothele bispora CBS 962.96]|uniref:Uncharacterized protein n=1 Tax=Dendrothele bispora (strain CBS 962.96) TaxID=1314807 RepID=A0A4S8MUM7_DENBC|nr:hypothetical protein K435DRAFT_848648 [Dendrothele bispora CBS 962.96]